jgi:Tfp pilus assembly protein PilW
MANRKLLASRHAARARGLSLIELMIAIALGLLVIAAVLALFVNISRTNNEMAKMNRQIENGRFAIQLLQEDVVHAGFWGGHVPQFDDLTVVAAPLDAPTALPAPCLAHSAANWDATYIANLIGIPMQGYEAAPAGCAVVSNKQIDTDVLVVRYAKTCVAGVGSCESDTAGKLYFQSSLCENEVSGAAQGGDATSITLDAGSSVTDNFYKGVVIRIVSGPGAGTSRTVTGYVGATKVATVNSSWTTIPDNSSIYAFGLGYVLGTDGYVFTKKDCATQADKRKLVSNIYYIRDYASTPGDGIPTLMRSSLDLAGGVLAHQAAEPLIEGIQGFRVEYGIDKVSKTGGAVNYTNSVAWENPYNRVSPKNRGDGIPETYVSAADLTCNGIADCDAANVVAARIHVLARNLEPTPGYTDTKTYQLGNTPAGTPFTMGPFKDRFKRHVFSTTVRLANPAGRRDTP